MSLWRFSDCETWFCLFPGEFSASIFVCSSIEKNAHWPPFHFLLPACIMSPFSLSSMSSLTIIYEHSGASSLPSGIILLVMITVVSLFLLLWRRDGSKGRCCFFLHHDHSRHMHRINSTTTVQNMKTYQIIFQSSRPVLLYSVTAVILVVSSAKDSLHQAVSLLSAKSSMARYTLFIDIRSRETSVTSSKKFMTRNIGRIVFLNLSQQVSEQHPQRERLLFLQQSAPSSLTSHRHPLNFTTASTAPITTNK